MLFVSVQVSNKTFPTPYIVAIVQNIKAPNETRYARLIQDFVELLPSLADAGWSGYFAMIDTNISIQLLWHNGNFDVANATFVELMNKNTDVYFSISLITFLPSFYDSYMGLFVCSNSCLPRSKLA